MDKLKQIESRYNASLEVSEEDFDWLVKEVKWLNHLNTELDYKSRVCKQDVSEMEVLIKDMQGEIEIYKTMLESSQGTTQAWVNKYNELEKKYDKALTVISSKKIMEMRNALNEICRYVNQVGEPIEVYNIANKALKGEGK